MLSDQVFGAGENDRNTTPEYCVGGTALKGPQRKRPCCCRALTRGFFGSIPEDMGAIQPMVGGMERDWGWFMNNVLSLQLARERVWQSRGKSLGLPRGNSETTGPEEQSTSSQTLLERLEAENAQLRSSVVELVLQIQILRDGSRTLTA
jgi:hypothetical protein